MSKIGRDFPNFLPTLKGLVLKTNYVGKYLMMNSTSAYAVIDGVKARGGKGNYSTQRVKFDSNDSG